MRLNFFKNFGNKSDTSSVKEVHSNILKDIRKLKQFDPISFLSKIFKKKDRRRLKKAQDKIEKELDLQRFIRR